MEAALELPKLVAPGEPVRRVGREAVRVPRLCLCTTPSRGLPGAPPSCPGLPRKEDGGAPGLGQGQLHPGSKTALSHPVRASSCTQTPVLQHPICTLWALNLSSPSVHLLDALVVQVPLPAPPPALCALGPWASDLPVLWEAVQKQHEGPIATSSGDIVQAQARALREGTV